MKLAKKSWNGTSAATGHFAQAKRGSWAGQHPWMQAKAVVGGLIVCALIVIGTLSPWIAPYDPGKQVLEATLKEPQWFDGAHFLGTDSLGRDILSRIIYGARVSLLVAFAVVVISGFVGVTLVQISLVIGTFSMASAIIAEASLSFLGLGVPPEIPTWGTMLADSRSYISTAWWLALFPGLCIFLTVLGINLLGDAIRDLLDPRLKRTVKG